MELHLCNEDDNEINKEVAISLVLLHDQTGGTHRTPGGLWWGIKGGAAWLLSATPWLPTWRGGLRRGAHTKPNPTLGMTELLSWALTEGLETCYPWHMPYSSWTRNESPLPSLLPQMKAAALRKQARLGARQQAAVHRSLALGVPGYPGLGSGRARPAVRETNSSSFRKKEGEGQSPRSCWNKFIRFRLGTAIHFSCPDPAGTPVVPQQRLQSFSQRGPDLAAVKQE